MRLLTAPSQLIRHAVFLACVLLTTWIGATAATAPDQAPAQPRYLAVVGLKTLGATATNGWLGVAVGEELATRLGSDRQHVCTLERLQLNELLATRGQPAPMLALGGKSAEADRRCANVLRSARSSQKLAGADALLLGSVICTPPALKATTRLVNVETGAVEAAVLTETPYAAGDPAQAVQALAVDLTAKWCVKLNVTLTPEMKATASDKPATYEAWGKAREYLYRGQYEECLEQVKWAEGQVSDPNLVQGLLGTRDEAWEMQFATAQADPQRKDAFLKQMLATAGSTYAAYKRGFATAAYYYGRALERAGQLGEAEARYRECLQQRPGRVRWDMELGSRCLSMTSGGGVVYACAESGTVMAIEAATGRVLWRFSIPGEAPSVTLADEIVLVYGVAPPPQFPANEPLVPLPPGLPPPPPKPGQITPGERMPPPPFPGKPPRLYAVDRLTGKVRWTIPFVEAPPRVSGNALYCEMFSSAGSPLRALNVSTGAVLWEVPRPDGMIPQVLAQDAEGLYASDSSGTSAALHLTKIRASDGAVLWRTALPQHGTSLDEVAVGGGRAYARYYTVPQGGRVSELDARTGKVLRQRTAWEGMPGIARAGGVTYVAERESVKAFKRDEGALLWQRKLEWWVDSGREGIVAGDSHAVYLPTPEGVMALDAKRGQRLWLTPSEEQVSRLWAAHGNVYGERSSDGAVLAWDAQTGALLSSYQFGGAFSRDPSLAIEMPVKGLVCAHRETGVRAVEMNLATGGDRAEHATAGLVRCMVATGRADQAWRLAARSLWENETRDTPFMVAAAQARVAGNDRRSPCLITHAASRLWGPSAAPGKIWEAPTNEQGRGRDVRLAVDEDRLFVTSYFEGGYCGVAARRAATGELLWERKCSRPGTMSLAGAGKTVCLYGEAGVYAHDAQSGALLWQTAQTMHFGTDLFLVTGQHAYLQSVACPTPETPVARKTPGQTEGLVALDLRTGRTAWAAGLDGLLEPVWASNGAIGCLACQTNAIPAALYVFDSQTGRRLWSRRGNLELVGKRPEGGLVLIGLREEGHTAGVEAVEVRTGQVRWTRRPENAYGAGADAAVCYIQTDDGFEVVDPANGTVRWRGEESMLSAVMAPERGLLYVFGVDGSVTAHDALTGTARWRRPDEVPMGQYVNFCLTRELLICGDGSGTVLALDAATGRVRWEFRGCPSNPQDVVLSGTLEHLGDVDGGLVWVCSHGSPPRQVLLLDEESGELLAACVADDSIGQRETGQGKVCLDIDGYIVALDLQAMRRQKPPEAVWLTDAQGYVYTVWGKGALAVRKALDGIPLSQIMRYDHWQSEQELATEINRLATLADWDGEGALAADPATLCPPFLLVDPELVKEGVCPAAQVFQRAWLATRGPMGRVAVQREYLEAAARLAPRWEEPQRALMSLRPDNDDRSHTRRVQIRVHPPPPGGDLPAPPPGPPPGPAPKPEP